MITPPPLPEATKRKKRRLSNKHVTTQPSISKKKRSLQPISVSTSPNTSRSPSPTQSTSSESFINTQPAITTTTTKRSIRAASAAINKREQEKESSVETSSLSSQPPTSDPTSPAKRSLRAASDAISKRELEKKLSASLDVEKTPVVIIAEEKKPVVKKRRKLNTQKAVLVPNAESPSDEIELEGASLNSYSKYLNPNKSPIKVMPITLGVSKKRKIVPKKSIPQPQLQVQAETNNYTTTTTTNTNNNTTNMEEEQLDLSQHVILPNSSYIAHLRQPRRSSMDSGNYYSDQSSNTSDKSSPTSEFFDAASDFDGQQDVFMSSLDDNESTTEFMDFEFKSQDMMIDSPPSPPSPVEVKKGFWKSVMTFARFSN